MGGVDFMDQQLDGLDVLRKFYKWYKRPFLILVMQCSLSAHKLYRLNGGKDVFILFLNVCTQLLLNASRSERLLRRSAVDNIARLTGRNHWPGRRETPAEWKGAKSKLKKCKVCMAKGKKTQGKETKTTWICKGCPGEPGLCVDKDCFEIYHTKFDFSE